MPIDGASPSRPSTKTSSVQLCLQCGEKLIQALLGRPRLFCTDSCKDTFHYRRNGVIRAVETRAFKKLIAGQRARVKYGQPLERRHWPFAAELLERRASSRTGR